MLYECKVGSFAFTNKNITNWKSTGVLSISDYYGMSSIKNTKNEFPILKNDEKMYVYLKGNHFQQNNVLTTSNDHVINGNVINIYIVYKLDPIAASRDTATIQNALVGAMQITNNADINKYKYKGYGICFDGRKEFAHVRKRGNFNDTTTARNVIIFGVDMSFSKHTNNKKKTIFTLWVKIMFKKLMIIQYSQKKYIIETLQT